MKRKWKLSEISQNDIPKNGFEVAVLPVGATEPHNFHLPYGSDMFHAEYISNESCKIAVEKGASIIQLPVIPFSVDANMLGFPLAINVYQKTLNLYVKDIIDSLIHHKINKIVIINGHGGNDFKPFLRDLFPDCEAFVCFIDWWKVGNDIYKEIFEFPDDHAGEMETSVNMVMNSELVNLAYAKDGKFRTTQFEAINNGWVSIARKWTSLTDSSGVGYPMKATKEKGEKYLSVTIERISNFLFELSKAEKTDIFPFTN